MFLGIISQSNFLKKILALSLLFSFSVLSVEAKVQNTKKRSSVERKSARVPKARKARAPKVLKVKASKASKVRASKVLKVKASKAPKVRAPKVLKVKASKASKVRAPKVLTTLKQKRSQQAPRKSVSTKPLKGKAAKQREAARIAAIQNAARLEAARLEAARLEAARLEAARLEAARLEARLEEERLAAARLEEERLAAARLEEERIERERQRAEAYRTHEEFMNLPFEEEALGLWRFNNAGEMIPFSGFNLYPSDVRSRGEVYIANGVDLPAAPVFMPYHPAHNLHNTTAPAFTVNVRFPTGERYIPAMLRNYLVGIDPRLIKSSLVFQDAPWRGVPLQFKPQPGFSPETPPICGDPSDAKVFRAQVGVFSRKYPLVRIQGQPDGALLETVDLSVHPDAANYMIYSGDVLPIENFNPEETHVLYSIARQLDFDSGALQQVFVTTHVLLNDEDQPIVEHLLPFCNNLTGTEEVIRRVKLGGTAFPTFDPDDAFFYNRE